MIRKIKSAYFPEDLSAVCLGCARFGGEYSEEYSFELLDLYYALGGRFLDTANVYGRWSESGRNMSEITIGRWIASRGITDMVVQSKCCHYLPEAPHMSRVDRKSAWEDLEDSRKALGLDTIPIYLTHRDNRNVDIREIVDFLADMVTKGRIKRFGLSNYSADRVEAALDYLGNTCCDYFAGVSNEWSLALENAGKYDAPDGMKATDASLWKLHTEKGLPLLPFSASAKGFYAKLKSQGERAVRSDWMNDRQRYVLRELEKISEETGAGVNAISVAYLLTAGITAVPIVAVSTPDQLREFEKISELSERLSGRLTNLSLFNQK